MKYRFIIPLVIISLLSFPSWSEPISENDLVQRGGLSYKKFTDIPFTGEVVYLYQGTLLEKKTYKDGKLDGPFISFHPNGQLEFKVQYKDGKKHGLSVGYHPDGSIGYEGFWKQNSRDGLWKGFYSDGSIDPNLTGIWEDGRKVND